jgi:tetratricopeptide (TPR) repeat protein
MPANPALRLVSLAVLCACAALALDHRAKIAVEGGAELPGVPLLIPLRADMLVGECLILNVFGNGTVAYRVPWVRDETTIPDGCRITIRLAGYRTTDATLTEGSTVTLKRIGDREGSTVSLTSLKATKEARKSYDRGLAAANRQKYEEAAKAFEAAVAAYPQYAQAWSDLGLVQVALKRPVDARASWERAVKCDAQYLKPYVQLARLAVGEGRNEDAIDITSRGLEFSPVEFPALYFYNAVANFNLKHYDAAEKSALQTIAHDSKREIPMAESLLGSVLGIQGHLDTAIDHLRKYLEISPQATDAAAIRQKIAELERRGMEMK